MTDISVSDLRPWREWRAEEGGALFRTDTAWEWFARQHKAALVASGEYFPRMGPPGTLVGPNIGRIVLEILRAEAVAREVAA